MTAAIAPTTLPVTSIGSRDDTALDVSAHALGGFATAAALFCNVPFGSLVCGGVDVAWSDNTARAGAFPDHESFDQYTILGTEVFEVPDVASDVRFAGRTPVGGVPQVAFYAGAPLLAADGRTLGTLAVLGAVPQRLSDGQRAALVALARQVSIHFALTEELVRARLRSNSPQVERSEPDLELERIHKQLLDASRLAGMAEVASNVLHNVGNVLTSVNVSASLVAECVRDAKVAGLGRAAAMLKEREADLAAFLTSDERGRRLPAYLAQLAEQLQGNQRLALKELVSLRDNIDHIKETVAMQQSYAKLCGVAETVSLAALIEDSLRMNAAALARHAVTVQCEIEHDVPAISVDKHKILQVLVNLIRNAKYACDESGRADKLVILRLQANERTVRICVIDNGVGIHPDNMGRLFRHGFTTRKTGHGFGLHSGALAAKELGGALTAHSDGPGQGATFILEIPRGDAGG
jgi:signal transduction histidine kinase